MRKKFQKLKMNNGFTLMETLIVVAIISILFGISVLGVSGWVKAMKMTEMDSYAKNIYLEAQNQLASLEVEGSLTKLCYDLTTEDGQYFDLYANRKLEVSPADYDDSIHGDYYKRLYYFTNYDNSIITEFVPEKAQINENGCYLLELNPESGDVYGVFYWESDNEHFQGNANTIYATIQEMEKQSEDSNNRERASRSEYEIGYYGGIVAQTTIATDYKLNQEVEIVDGEELYVKISYDYKGRMLQYRNADTVLDICVTIEGVDSHAKIEKEIDILQNDFVNFETLRLETGLLLDGLGSGQNFDTITEREFIPGENLNIKVETKFKQGDVILKERSKTTCNSLFEKVETKDGNHVITVSAVRHLRNLDEKYYTYEDSKKVHIVQSNDIDFDVSTYAFDANSCYRGDGEAIRPVDGIAPITNAVFLENAVAGKETEIIGNDFVIRNLTVEAAVGTENAGLFAKLTNVAVSNFYLEDYTLIAEDCINVGALAGQVKGGMISSSGVHLATTYENAAGIKSYYNQEFDEAYGTVLNRHYEEMSVTGKTNVGGLVGTAISTTLNKCYAAVKVSGNKNVGGLVGNIQASQVVDSYASGNVVHLTTDGDTIGGLIGMATNVTVDNAFSSGDVYGADVVAGFVGSSINGNFVNCASYGEVLNTKGNDDFTGIAVGGMICGNVNNSDGNGTCHYLSQLDYNTSTAFVDPMLSYGYSKFTDSLSAEDVYKIADTMSYDAVHLYKAFPFKAVTDKYYGNWPLQYVINTALVYYEKYENGGYGYYSVTSLTDTSGDAGATAGEYVWVLNNLRNEACIEDGYALLSMYYLDSFDYVSYQFTGGWDESNSSWQQNASGTLKIAETYPENINEINDYAVVLSEPGFIEFKAYAKTPGIDEYTVDYSDKEVKDSFITGGMYLYQLPYDLQCTDRYDVYNFYDRFVIYNAFAKGNTSEDAKSVIGGERIEEAETFFYSPHFAKTAVNPGLNVASNAILPNPETVFVRSARQLNALGRVPYYWNREGGAAKMAFLQEVDIDFGTYTDGTKTYCGKNYDLMDTSEDNPVANQPIGMPDLPGTYCQFRNTYDGNYHEIIDYCQSTNEQFAGLFGEIRDATIKNVFMTVSKRGAGYIRSSHQPASGNATRRAGVGALVGLAYLEGNTIENCAAAGYTVEYVVNNVRSGCVQPRGISVGGLFGMCMSGISNCTTTNDVLLTLNTNYNDSNKAVFLGGLAGSFYYGTMQNVYSGGTIDINISGDYYIYRLRIGGLCPGFMYTARDAVKMDAVVYKNFYTYTDVSMDIWSEEMNDNLNGGKAFDHFIPSVSRMSWNKDNAGNTECLDEVSVPGGFGAYYIKEMFERHLAQVPEDSAVRKYFSYHTHGLFGITKHGKTDDPISYDDLADIANLKAKWNLNNDDMSHPAAESYPTSSALSNSSYPFPAFNYKMVDGEKVYVHFGDWILKTGNE